MENLKTGQGVILETRKPKFRLWMRAISLLIIFVFIFQTSHLGLAYAQDKDNEGGGDINGNGYDGGGYNQGSPDYNGNSDGIDNSYGEDDSGAWDTGGDDSYNEGNPEYSGVDNYGNEDGSAWDTGDVSDNNGNYEYSGSVSDGTETWNGTYKGSFTDDTGDFNGDIDNSDGAGDMGGDVGTPDVETPIVDPTSLEEDKTAPPTADDVATDTGNGAIPGELDYVPPEDTSVVEAPAVDTTVTSDVGTPDVETPTDEEPVYNETLIPDSENSAPADTGTEADVQAPLDDAGNPPPAEGQAAAPDETALPNDAVAADTGSTGAIPGEPGYVPEEPPAADQASTGAPDDEATNARNQGYLPDETLIPDSENSAPADTGAEPDVEISAEAPAVETPTIIDETSRDEDESEAEGANVAATIAAETDPDVIAADSGEEPPEDLPNTTPTAGQLTRVTRPTTVALPPGSGFTEVLAQRLGPSAKPADQEEDSEGRRGDYSGDQGAGGDFGPDAEEPPQSAGVGQTQAPQGAPAAKQPASPPVTTPGNAASAGQSEDPYNAFPQGEGLGQTQPVVPARPAAPPSGSVPAGQGTSQPQSGGQRRGPTGPNGQSRPNGGLPQTPQSTSRQMRDPRWQPAWPGNQPQPNQARPAGPAAPGIPDMSRMPGARDGAMPQGLTPRQWGALVRRQERAAKQQEQRDYNYRHNSDHPERLTPQDREREANRILRGAAEELVGQIVAEAKTQRPPERFGDKAWLKIARDRVQKYIGELEPSLQEQIKKLGVTNSVILGKFATVVEGIIAREGRTDRASRKIAAREEQEIATRPQSISPDEYLQHTRPDVFAARKEAAAVQKISGAIDTKYNERANARSAGNGLISSSTAIAPPDGASIYNMRTWIAKTHDTMRNIPERRDYYNRVITGLKNRGDMPASYIDTLRKQIGYLDGEVGGV